jgi:hypothetical protein
MQIKSTALILKREHALLQIILRLWIIFYINRTGHMGGPNAVAVGVHTIKRTV